MLSLIICRSVEMFNLNSESSFLARSLALSDSSGVPLWWQVPLWDPWLTAASALSHSPVRVWDTFFLYIMQLEVLLPSFYLANYVHPIIHDGIKPFNILVIVISPIESVQVLLLHQDIFLSPLFLRLSLIINDENIMCITWSCIACNSLRSKPNLTPSGRHLAIS